MKLTEKQITYENGRYWVCDNKTQYTIYQTGLTHSEAIEAYEHSDDGLSIAKARVDYLVKRERNKP